MRSRSMGMQPALWAASTRNGTPRSRHMAPIRAISFTVPVTLEAWVHRDPRRRGHFPRELPGIDPPLGPASTTSTRTPEPRGPQGTEHGVVLHARGEHTVSGAQKTEEDGVQGLGRVLREDDPRGVCHVKELREELPRAQDRPTRLDGFRVTRPAGIAAPRRIASLMARGTPGGLGQEVAALSR